MKLEPKNITDYIDGIDIHLENNNKSIDGLNWSARFNQDCTNKFFNFLHLRLIQVRNSCSLLNTEEQIKEAEKQSAISLELSEILEKFESLRKDEFI